MRRFVIGFVLLLSSSVALAEPSASPAPSDLLAAGSARVFPSMAADVRSHFSSERVLASRALWGWSIVGLSGGVYAGLALAGSASGGAATEAVAWVATLGGVIGVVRAVMRGRAIARLDQLVRGDMESAAALSVVTLGPVTRAGVDRELRSRLTAVRSSARGALRAGCVLPVLLGGIGAYGVSAGGSDGSALAGLGIGGALVIGAPSMLSYWGLQGRLARLEDLVARWDRALGGGEMPR